MATITATPPTIEAQAGGRRRTAARLAILLVTLALAGLVLRDGLALRMLDSDPLAAARLAPGDARIAAAAAHSLAGKDRAPQRRLRRELVAAALARDTTDPTTIELAALDAEQGGDTAKAARLFALSDAISRRSLPTRLWLIQHAVDRGDVAGALRDFDIALRTSTDAPAILFPALGRAAGDPVLSTPIARLLDRPSDWREAFLHDAGGDSRSAVGVMNVLLRMRDRGWVAANGLDDGVVAQLLAQERYGDARRLRDAFHPVADTAALLRDPGFANPRAGYPFGWGLVAKGDLGAERGRAARGAVLRYQALPGGLGPVATQLLILPPGRYLYSVSTAIPASDPEASPYWTITCAGGDGAQLGVADQPRARGARLALDFIVPGGCAAQWLALSLRPSDVADGQSGAVAAAAIERRHGSIP